MQNETRESGPQNFIKSSSRILVMFQKKSQNSAIFVEILVETSPKFVGISQIIQTMVQILNAENIRKFEPELDKR